MKKYLFLIVPLLLNWNVYSQTETNKTYYKVELTAVYTTVNDDNGSDEYRYNMSFMGNVMSCIQQSGGPYNWYGHHRVLADQTVNNPLFNFTFSVDFFEDAACGGWDCSYKGSNCGVLKKDANRCFGDHGFDYKTDREPGKWHRGIEVMGICGSYGIRIDYFYTPSKPTQPQNLSGSLNKCGGSTYQLSTSSLYTNATYIWQEETNGNGAWTTIPGQTTNICTITAPTFSVGYYDKRYRVFTVMNGTSSVEPSLVSNTFSIWPSAPTIDNNDTYRTITHVKCNGDATGKLKINRVDGSGNYYYSLAKIDGSTPYNANFTTPGVYPEFTGLTAGRYRLAVRHNNVAPVNCEDWFDFDVTQPPKLLIASLSSTEHNGYKISCNGGTDGNISMTGSGGVSPYTFSYTLGSQTISNATGSFTNLSTGNYAVSIQDNNGCITTGSINLNQPGLPLSSIITPIDVKCNGNNDGIINFNSSGGVSVYGYSINNGVTFMPSSVFNNLPPGTYECVAKDANNCQVKATRIITEPTKLLVSEDSVHHVTCYGGFDGFISVLSTGGVGTHRYSIKNGVFQNGKNFNMLSSASHIVKVRDGKNCITTINVQVDQPEQLDISFTVTPVQCNGFDNGKVEAEVSGGVEPYTYLWAGQHDSDPIIEDLPPGNYSLTIKDLNNCSHTETTPLIEPSGTLTAFIVEKKDAKCNTICNGEAEVSVSGGTPPYRYLWNDNNATDQAKVTNLCKGNYKVEILDNRECTTESAVSINDTLNFTFNIPDSTIICPSKALTLDAGYSGSQYSWNYENTNYSNSQTVSLTQGGDYTVTVTTHEGCYGTKEFYLRTSIDALQANFLIPSFVALGDTVVFVEVSHPLPDSISWEFQGSPEVIDSAKESPVLYFANQGTYTVKLTAHLGECIDSLSKNITFFIPPDDPGSSNPNLVGLNKIRTIKLYPNPNDGIFKIEIELDLIQNIDLRIFSSQGYPITSYTDSGNDKYLIDFKLPIGTGVYLVKVQTATDYKTITFIVN